MQDSSHYGPGVQPLCDACQLLLSVGPNADQVFGLEDFNDGLEMAQAGIVHWLHGIRRNLVRGEVCSSFLHPDQRAVIGYEVIFEKCIRVREPFRKKPPETAATDFRALTRDSMPLRDGSS